MKRLFTLPTLALTAAFASTSMAATVPADQSHTSTSTTSVETKRAQDSANGSMTNTDLTGHVDQDTSELTTGTTSGTTSGAIIDHTSRKKKSKKKRKHSTSASETMSETTSDTTTSSGEYGNENLNAPTTTQGRTANDEIGLGKNGDPQSSGALERSTGGGQSSTGGD